MNFALCLIDCFFTAAPVRLLHVWVPFIFGFVYIVFTYIFYAAGLTITRNGVVTRYVYKVPQPLDSFCMYALSTAAACLLEC